jgi:uncharacterized protein YjeT (DUF2065 family)
MDREGAVTMDDRWFPVVIGTWWGDMAPCIDAYFGWYDRQLSRAQAEGVKLVLVVDGLDVTRPTSAVRKRFVAESEARAAVNQARVVGMFVVVHGAFLMGVLASVVTLVRGGLRLSSAGDMPTALARGLVKLDLAGVARPPGLDAMAYQRPSRPA